MRVLGKFGPLALVAAVVAGLGWVALAGGGGSDESPSASPSPTEAGCHPVPGTEASGQGIIRTPDWEVTVTATHAETELPGTNGASSIKPATGHVFVVVTTSFTRIGSGAQARISSARFVVMCENGARADTAAWNPGDGFCRRCGLDLETSDRTVTLTFALHLERADALQIFSLSYGGGEPISFGPPRDL
jgi:hypothetical protein